MRLDPKVLAGAVVLFALTGLAARAAAPSAIVTWSAPTTYTDNSPIGAGEIKSYTVEWRRTAGGAVAGSVNVSAPALTATVPVACGTYVFDVIATAGAVSGAPSASVSFDSGIGCTPNPPTGLKVSKG